MKPEWDEAKSAANLLGSQWSQHVPPKPDSIYRLPDPKPDISYGFKRNVFGFTQPGPMIRSASAR